MRFHPPFDEKRWDAAVKSHAQMRWNLRKLRQQFPPQTADERRLLKQYRDLIQDFGRELLKPRDKIDAVELNQSSEAAVAVFVQYLMGRLSRGRMEHRFLTPEISSEVVALLINKRGWAATRVAKTLGVSTDFVKRVRAGKQNLEMRDLAALAKASGEETHMLLYKSVPEEKLTPELRGLLGLVKGEIERHDELVKALGKPAKRKGSRDQAA
jgi:hypothetical protein